MLTRRRFLSLAGTTTGCMAFAPTLLIPRGSRAYSLRLFRERGLTLYNIHTGEHLKCTYWAQGRYDVGALKSIRHFFRDHRNNQQHAIDPTLLDVLFGVTRQLDTQNPIHLVSGFRSPVSNSWLAEKSGGVARNSQHLNGKAADIFIEGTLLKNVHVAAKNLNRGGVGRYSRFVHVDTGRVRYWGGV